jgi:uncharacterized protein
MELENGQDVMQIGDIGYWPPGKAFCIFFGETPDSEKGVIRPASAVTLIGKIIGDTKLLKKVPENARITLDGATIL